MNDDGNPCMSCGACCALFRVSFYWAEADDGAGQVPVALTEPLTPFLRCMAGSNNRSPRCRALQGQIGDSVSCAIYVSRPSPCREFRMSGEDGLANAACDRAWAHYGLPPLARPAARGEIIMPRPPGDDALGCQAVD
ncbi:MAG: YkgJ family cysteine cluster protein [Sodalis sp. (in: enterobacteria)]|uniref:YkgJ family cysteine cluster protein n=1 Tax=Sodalis sp. (in: enterobacteria) TaxID=1898979 RepID=UPI0039E4A6A4